MSSSTPLPPGEAEAEPVELPPAPHDVQREALARLRAARQQGRRRAIVVLATGLGKTWLAAFDFAQLREEIGRRPRVLFIAHRSELLKQAARTYRRQLRGLDETARVGWFFGKTNELAADLVFASVAKLARSENLARLKAEHFDYVVIDEVHHAAADSYRRILDHVGDPHFVLGLTATPDRADAADIMGLFDDFEAYRAGIAEGIKLERLTQFHYFGVKDEIDYDNIPWRNRKFDADRLAEAVQTEARMQTLWRSWNEHGGTRTLIFCCSVAHAVFVRSWLRARDVRVAAVFAAEGSDDRETALEQLERGELDAVCAVDVFNEGVDVPSIDRVVMLRPTESSVVFLQQLGRGLRASAGKDAVRVIDFVGNHRVFLERLRALLSLGGSTSTAAVRECLSSEVPIELPKGCSVDLELEAKELLSRLFRVGGADEVERVYRELCLERGAEEDPSQRPTAGELQRMGYLGQLDASFRVERVGDAWTVVFESRGGTRGTAAERNSDYAEGLELVLHRLGLASVDIADIVVESRETDRLTLEHRRLDLGESYPIRVGDAAELCRKISAAQAKVTEYLNRNHVIVPSAKSIDELPAVVDTLLDHSGLQDVWFGWVVGTIRNPRLVAEVRARWQREGSFLKTFAPYAHFCLRALLMLFIANRRGLLPKWKSTHLVDAQYLYYLPCCGVFVSADRLHRTLGPPLCRPDQRFIRAQDFKSGLVQLGDHLDKLDADQREQFKSRPPKLDGNVVTDAWHHVVAAWDELWSRDR